MNTLMVIDMQNIFNGYYDKWHVKGMENLSQKIENVILNERFDKIVFTEFVLPKVIDGAWVDYYKEYPEVLGFPSTFFDIVPVLKKYSISEGPLGMSNQGRKIIKSHKFSKAETMNIDLMSDGMRDNVYICGVASMCCVLSTVVELANNGFNVIVFKDLCLDSTDEHHQMALKVMESYSPMVSLI
jgi:nicotinamidase-related amidase